MRFWIAIVSLFLAVGGPALAQTIVGDVECACERAVPTDGCCPGAPACDGAHEEHDDDAPHGCPPLCHDCACAAYATLSAIPPTPAATWGSPPVEIFPTLATSPLDPPVDGVFHPPR